MSRSSQRRYFSRLKREQLAHDAGEIYLYREVQRLRAAGRTNAQIATELYIGKILVRERLD